MLPMDPIGTPRRALAGRIGESASKLANGASRNHAVSSTPASLWARYEQLKHVGTAQNLLVEEAITLFENLQQTHINFVKNASKGDPFVEQLKERETFYNEQYQKWNDVLTRDPFIVVLINGNDVLFHSGYVRLGEEGGRAAAIALQHAVRRWAATNLDTPLVEVATRVYANIGHIAQLCTVAGIVSSPDIVEHFARGFTRGSALCDFVDTGTGKDCAPAKMEANLKLHLRDLQCKQVFLGCGLGAARTLDHYKFDNEALDRITLIEDPSYDEAYIKLPFKKLQLVDLFQEAGLVETALDLRKSARPDSRNTSRFNPTSGIFTPAASSTPMSQTSHVPVSSRTLTGAVLPVHSRTMSLATSDMSEMASGGCLPSWSRVASNAKDLPYTDTARSTSTSNIAKPIATGVRVNVNDQRLDAPMDYDYDRVHRLKQIKLCNQHYIGKGCCHYNKGNENCPHIHDRQLSKEDLKYLRMVARETVCKRGSSCRDPECIYGHHCPYPKATEGSMRGIGCVNGSTCRFGQELHGVDMKVHRVIPSEPGET